MKSEHSGLRTGLLFAALVSSVPLAPAMAAVAPPLGTAGGFAVLGTNSIPVAGTVTCTTSTINGDVGSTFNSITNTGCTINGTVVAPVPASVVNDFNNAYAAADLLNPVCDGVIPIVTSTLAPGVYCSDAGTTIGAGVILTLSGGVNDVWVFKVGTGPTGGALTGNSFQVVMDGGAQACNVYWWTADAATLTDSSFLGTILAGSAVTVTRGDYLGRAMATTDVTVTDVDPLTFAGCEGPPAFLVPSLSEWGMMMLAGLLAVLGVAAVRRLSS